MRKASFGSVDACAHGRAVCAMQARTALVSCLQGRTPSDDQAGGACIDAARSAGDVSGGAHRLRHELRDATVGPRRAPTPAVSPRIEVVVNG